MALLSVRLACHAPPPQAGEPAPYRPRGRRARGGAPRKGVSPEGRPTQEFPVRQWHVSGLLGDANSLLARAYGIEGQKESSENCATTQWLHNSQILTVSYVTASERIPEADPTQK